MKTVLQFVQQASTQLNDQYLNREYTRWSRQTLINYLNGALTELYTYKPEAFARADEIVNLVPGYMQSIAASGSPVEDKYLVSLDFNDDLSPLHEADFDLLKASIPYLCCPTVISQDAQGTPFYKGRSFSLNPKNAKEFYVSPAVPQSIDEPYVYGTVLVAPTEHSLLNTSAIVQIDPKYNENILDYMIGKAFDIDNESQMSRSNADRHLARFYNALGVKYKVQSAYRAGNYNGAVGDGDPQARI